MSDNEEHIISVETGPAPLQNIIENVEPVASPKKVKRFYIQRLRHYVSND